MLTHGLFILSRRKESKFDISKFLTLFLLIFGTFPILPAKAERINNSLCASNSKGLEIQNPSNKAEDYKIIARGVWSGGGKNPLHDGNGSPRGASHPDRLLASNLPNSALILRRPNGATELIGTQYRFYIPAHSYVLLVMNDYDYGNNNGCLELEITW